MVRKIAGLLTALLFVAGLSLATEDKKDDKTPKSITMIGNFESYKKETLKLNKCYELPPFRDGKAGLEAFQKAVQKAKEEAKDTEFKVPGDTPVGYAADKDKKKVLKAKVHLKDLKKGTLVAVTLDEKKKVLGVGVTVSELPRDEEEDKDK
ncbi:MAG TPA: hypothetical protein VMG10_29720 [Gemmataceae bacterium]|nr:hypothetical protein [Gemmataceae bacterium]